MIIQEDYWVTARKVRLSHGCLFLSMHPMGHFMNTFIVSEITILFNARFGLGTFCHLPFITVILMQMEKAANYLGHGV